MVLAPENTLPAFELALSHGADVMEIDVRLSRDNQVIVIHDERVDRTCNGHGRVRDQSFAQLKKLNAGYHFTDLDGRSHRQYNTGLMSLAELFDCLPDVPVNIDIKDNSEQAAMAVARVIDEAERHHTVNVASFHTLPITLFREQQPDITTTATQSEVARLFFMRRMYKRPVFEYLQIPLQYLRIPLATPDFIRHARARDIKTVYWTINDPVTMQSLLDRGVSGIVTDRADIAAPLFGKIPA